MAVTTDTKRKIPLPIPATTLIKIETDATTLDQTKTLQAVSTIGSNTGTVFTDPNMTPLVTTHVIYQHPTNLILSQPPTAETPCRSQATSPVACLTPPPDNLPLSEEESLGVQDASNQTDIPICSEDDSTIHTLPDVGADLKSKFAEEEPKLEAPEKEISTPVVIKPMEMQKPVEMVEPAVAEVPKVVTETVPETAGEPEYPSDSPPTKPDLSGLELLSNSIVEFENCRKSSEQSVKLETKNGEHGDEVLTRIAHMTLKDTESESMKIQKVDDSLGGLDLLCALAEQRIMEEVDEKNKSQTIRKEKTKDIEKSQRKKEKRKSKRHPDEPRHKKSKSNDEYRRLREEEKERLRQEVMELERMKLTVLERVANEKGLNNQNDGESVINYDSDNVKPKCFCKENYRSYKSPESKEEVRKFIASKSQTGCCKGEFPCMNAMEIDMRMKLADLQRQYREKQLELSKLKPKKHPLECAKKSRSRKKSTNSDRSATPPPLLDKMDVPMKPNKNIPDLLKPPTLCAETIKLPKLGLVKQSDYVKSDHESQKRHHHSSGTDLSDCTPEKRSSSKKRKVGRPKRLLSSSGLRIATETIVAKKPKKGSLVGYLLAAKEKLKLQNKNGLVYSDSPPRYVEEVIKTKHKSHKSKNNGLSSKVNLDQPEKSCKIRPKLKAEPTVKIDKEEEDAKNAWYLENIEEERDDEEECEEEEEEEEQQQPILQEEAEQVTAIDTEDDKDLSKSDEEIEEPTAKIEDVKNTEEISKPGDTRCCLTAEHLEMGKLRVLTAMGGLFYAGHLNAVEPPDVYSITLDGERGNRPHIMSREEILRDTVSRR